MSTSSDNVDQKQKLFLWLPGPDVATDTLRCLHNARAQTLLIDSFCNTPLAFAVNIEGNNRLIGREGQQSQMIAGIGGKFTTDTKTFANERLNFMTVNWMPIRSGESTFKSHCCMVNHWFHRRQVEPDTCLVFCTLCSGLNTMMSREPVQNAHASQQQMVGWDIMGLCDWISLSRTMGLL